MKSPRLIGDNDEKEKRAAELIIANKELAFQNDEKEKRANELIKSYYAGNTQRIKMLGYQKSTLDSLKSEYKDAVNMSINSKSSDFGIAPYDKEVIFSSSREINTAGTETTQYPYLNLYSATRNPTTGQLSNVKTFLSNIFGVQKVFKGNSFV